MTAQQYTCYLFGDAARETLEAVARGYAFPRKRGHHITERYGAPTTEGLHPVTQAEIYAFLSDHTGVEAFLVRVNGQERAYDGRLYHLTWSIDPKAIIPDAYLRLENDPGAAREPIRYAARHANSMIATQFHSSGGFISRHDFQPVRVPVSPVHIAESAAGHETITRLAL